LYSSFIYFEGQFPLPPPDGFPVVLGPFGGVHPLDFAIIAPFNIDFDYLKSIAVL
jgi:hypothetical protein